MKTLQTMAKSFLNLVYPLHCASCGKALDPLETPGVCAFCISKVKPNPRPHCASCGRTVQHASELCPECRRRAFSFERAYSACLYEGAIKELIHRFKYRSDLALGKTLAGFMIDLIKEDPEIAGGVDMVTYVPLRSKRLKERGYNQSKVLAAHISEAFGIGLADILEKTRQTLPQNELSREERLVNLAGAFRAKCRSISGRKILLVDDVMTTGATLDECSKALIEAGAESVVALTLARGS